MHNNRLEAREYHIWMLFVVSCLPHTIYHDNHECKNFLNLIENELSNFLRPGSNYCCFERHIF